MTDDGRRPLRKRFLARHGKPHNRLVWAINWDLVVSTLPDIGGRVFDLGCGSSPYRELLEHEGHDVVAVDWPGTRHGRQGVEVFADVSKALPFRDGVADTVTAFHVLEHLREPARFLAEVRRILRPGGTLVVSVPFMWGIHEAPDDYYRFTRHGLEHLHGAAGLDVVHIREATGFWSMVALKVCYRTFRGSGKWTRPLWRPVWAVLQSLGRLLDGRRSGADETAGYLLVARRAAAPAPGR